MTAPTSAPEPLDALRTVRTGTIRLDGPPERVFPLFTPEGERRWVPGWDPVHRYPADGRMEAGGVFVTRAPGEAETVWTVARYEPRTLRVAYDRVTPGVRAGTVTVRCEPAGPGSTLAHVTYAFTALSARGNEVLAAFTDQDYAAMLGEWERAINTYLGQA